MYRLLRALLFLLPPEWAHALAMTGLRLLSLFPGLGGWVRRRWVPVRPQLRIRLAGMGLEHPIGLAAGLDKDAEALGGLFALGFSALEVGTLTPRPQAGNPRPRLFRLREHRALINRMGFNNRGAAVAAQRLAAQRWRPGLVGVNLGKNRDTPLERALDDYRAAAAALAPHGDYVVVNLSSPNTPGLRLLQAPAHLESLLSGVQETLRQVAPGKPLFLKISPDLAPEAVDAAVDVSLACGVAGLVAANTTLERPLSHPRAQEAGGLSGAPLRERSTAVLRQAYRRAGGRLALIGVGGVFSAQDAYEKIRAGASLVQIYTGFIYEGPGLVARLTRELSALLRADGFTDIGQAVGADAGFPTRELSPPGPRPGPL